MQHILTVDIEEYFHSTSFRSVLSIEDWARMPSRVESCTERVLALMESFGVRATFFVLGYVARRYPALIRAIQHAGHEIACHGFMHQPVYEQGRAAFRDDVLRAKRLLEDTIGQPVVGYRAPAYSITAQSLWAVDLLIESGFQYDSSIFPVHHDVYGIPDAPRAPYRLQGASGNSILEFPIATVRWGRLNLPLGGGYLRIAPYRYTRWGLRRIESRDGWPAVLYFHPWELDPAQPRIPCGWRSRFRHYTRLGVMERTVQKVLSDFSFTSIRYYFETLNRESGVQTPDWRH